MRKIRKDEKTRKTKKTELPQKPGVYMFKKGRKFLYIGKAVNLRQRVKQQAHRLGWTGGRVSCIETRSEAEAFLLEAKLIKKHQPKYNIHWKDDKNYFYVGITQEPFPRIFITHQKEVKSQKSKVKINYLGPFVNGRDLKQKLKVLREVFPYRTCKTLPKKPCLWYHLKQCPAPCLFRSRRIEAYDIANLQGQEAAGAMVTFINGRPNKNLYRRFKIKTVRRPNDPAMLKEVLVRRFRHPEWGFPDLILVDGGKAQFSAALSAAPPRGAVMALAKKRIIYIWKT